MADVKFKDNSGEVAKALKRQVSLGLNAIGLKAQEFAVKDCPVDTGRLQNSITYKLEDTTVYIGTNVKYAKYVEFNDKAKHESGKAHFLRDAATTHSNFYKEIMLTALR